MRNRNFAWETEDIDLNTYCLVKMADPFEDEAEQTVSIHEYLKDVEEQELVKLLFYS